MLLSLVSKHVTTIYPFESYHLPILNAMSNCENNRLSRGYRNSIYHMQNAIQCNCVMVCQSSFSRGVKLFIKSVRSFQNLKLLSLAMLMSRGVSKD